MTEADVLVQLRLRREQLQHAEDVATALRDEIASIENGLGDRHRDCQRAAGELVSRTPQLLTWPGASMSVTARSATAASPLPRSAS